MRVLHTADWHAGRIWKSQDRLSELQHILEHLGDFVEREHIDLLLMSGDVFESQMPSPEAERAVSSFFKRLGGAGVPSIVIAGNHDHPLRMDTWGLLAEFVGVQARGLPRRSAEGGLIEVTTRSGEVACVAAVPWASPGRIVEALTLARDETLAKQQYADAMQRILSHLEQGFRHDTVNLVVAHSYIAGAKGCGSERIVTLGDEWAATAQCLPASAQYVALGHIHRPQRIDAAGPHTQYAGSPMQLDFGEVGDEKSFVVVDVAPRKPPKVGRVQYQGAVQLGQWAGTMTELERDADTLSHFGFLKVRITLDTPMPDLNRRARQILPNIVVVDAVLPESVTEDTDSDHTARAALGVAPLDQFRSFYQREHQREPQPETLSAFSDLYASASQE
jgi:DNA repair protein SbcD/Mre11